LATLLETALKPALRMAGITKRPGIGPSTDQTTELIAAVNRMLSSWSCRSHVVFSQSIDEYSLTSAKIYTIGAGGDFNNPRPLKITEANFIWPTSPEVRIPLRILDYDEWARISVQDIPSAPPWGIYYDNSYSTSGLGRIYITGQPGAGYTLELYTWQALSAVFAATSDVVYWPPGYEEAIAANLALRAVSLYPLESIIARNRSAMSELKEQARNALHALVTLNSRCPPLRNETAYLGSSSGGGIAPWNFGGGGGTGVEWVESLAAPDGVLTSFVFSATPVFCSFDGLNQFAGEGYNLVGTRTVQFLDPDGNVFAPAAGASLWAEIN